MDMSTFDFYPTFVDFNVMLAEEAAWQVVNNDVFNIDNMSDKELRQAIVEDVLCVTIWEKQTGKKADFTFDTLTRYLTEKQKSKVKASLFHDEIFPFFNHFPDNLRVSDNKRTLQAAMDYCGVWFNGYDMPNGIIRMDRESVHEAVEKHGGLDNLIDSMVMSLVSTHDAPTTLN